MKICVRYHLLCTVALAILLSDGLAQGQSGSDTLKAQLLGYVDANRDGLNDRFRDANGDGVNDVDLKPYRHVFQFQDQNQDGLNDLWRDQDGDGVNDLLVACLKTRGIKPKTPWIDRDGDGVLDADVRPRFAVDLAEFVLDADHDGKNDVTGLEINLANALGYRYGCVDEETDQQIRKFMDKDGDGMHDSFARRWLNDVSQMNTMRKYDFFQDADGDGIADDRGFGRMRQRGAGNQHGKKKP